MVVRKLTFNLGLRYDLYRPTVDKYNHLAWVDMRLPNPAIGGFPGHDGFCHSGSAHGSGSV